MHHRRSIRLRNHDYAQAGEYFVTIDTRRHESIPGVIRNGGVQLSPIGEIVKDEWLRTPSMRLNVQLDEYVIMPNHLHGIIVIHDDRKGVDAFVRANSSSPRRATPFRSPSGTVGAIIRGFKAASTKRVNEMRNTPGKPVWQRNYYEHVVRGEKDLERIRTYIHLNPERWDKGDEFGRNIEMSGYHAT